MSTHGPPLLGGPRAPGNFYVIHGHGGVVANEKNLLLKSVILHFYCRDGQTTSEAVRANPDADWRKLLNTLLLSDTVPVPPRLVETLSTGSTCLPLKLWPIPHAHSLYFCHRPVSDVPPHVHPLGAVPPEGMSLGELIRTQILPHARTHHVAIPVTVHWIACRVHLNPRQPTPMDFEPTPEAMNFEAPPVVVFAGAGAAPENEPMPDVDDMQM